jgi:hypothetical protein
MQTKINRRKFIQNSTITSAGMFLLPSMIQASSMFQRTPDGMSITMIGLTPISIIDGACMLAFRSGALSVASQEVITSDIHLRGTPGNKGRLAVLMPPMNKKILELVKTLKSGKNTKYFKEKRAIAFGWVAVNAVERHINTRLEGKTEDEIIAIRMHQDAMVIHGLSKPEHDTQAASERDMENLLNSILVRTITRVHTLKPDSDDGIGWVNRMSAWRKQNVETMQALAKAIVKPNILKAGKDFYEGTDKIIAYAIALQKGKLVKSNEIMSIQQEKMPDSLYGKALTEATRNILGIDQFLDNKMNLDEVEALLKI